MRMQLIIRSSEEFYINGLSYFFVIAIKRT